MVIADFEMETFDPITTNPFTCLGVGGYYIEMYIASARYRRSLLGASLGSVTVISN